jgi:translation initiation factor IF-2
LIYVCFEQIIGLNNVPLAGDEFESVDDLDFARERANARADAMRIERISAKAGEGKVTLSSIAASVSSGNQAGIDTHGLNVILKVDFQVSTLVKLCGLNVLIVLSFISK